jgi:hypothetical protein
LTLAAGMALGLFAQIGLTAHLFSLLVPTLGTRWSGFAMTLVTIMASSRDRDQHLVSDGRPPQLKRGVAAELEEDHRRRSEDVMNKHLRVFLCVLVGAVTAAASVAVIVAVADELIIWGFTHNHPNDLSAGDSAGWAFLFLSPVILPIGTIIGLVLGSLVYAFARARFSTARQSQR